jgi:glycosyltransferase involved in cell wall biosynthesis
MGRAHAAPRFDLTLGVVSHVPHWPSTPQPIAYEPYVREIEIWARLFARVDVCAPYAEWPVRGNQVAYAAENIRWLPLRYSNWPGPRRHVLRFRQLPALRKELRALFETSDLLLLRSPAPLAMLARSLAGGGPTLTKWAGAQSPPLRQSPLTRLEWTQLVRGTQTALVYGRSARPHLVSFIPALMSEAELAEAAGRAQGREWEPPWELLLVGRLAPEKGFELVLQGLAALRRRRSELDWRLTVVGDGVRRTALEELAVRVGIGERVTFAGAVPFAEVGDRFARAHVVLIPGVREGWPKTVAEAWAHGAVPVGAAAGLVPELLADGAGVAFDPTPAGLASALESLLSVPGALEAMAAGGPARCCDLTLEVFERRLEEVLVERLGLR